MKKFKIGNFDGPLDLLLKMIEKNKLEICEFSLSKICDEYIEFINAGDIDLEEIADYVYVSSKLIKIKSNYMLKLSNNDEDNCELVYSLEEYMKYKRFAENIKKLYDNRDCYLEKIPDEIYSDDKIHLNKIKLCLLPLQILNIKKNEDKIYIKKNKKSINEKIEKIKNIFHINRNMYFIDVLEDFSKEECVVSLLSSLQLTKERYFNLYQNKNFDRIKIMENDNEI